MTKKNKKKSAETDKMRATATTNMLGSRWMKNLKGLVIIMCLIIFGSQAVPTKAQNNADSLALLIYIEDAIGQKDSVFVYIKQGASNGFNPELGEINLYGTPMKDPEIRIVQRTDTNWYSKFNCAELMIRPYWLYDTSYRSVHFGDSVFKNDTILYLLNTNGSGASVRTFPENLDLKKCYFDKYSIIEASLKIYSEHPPITLQFSRKDFKYALFNDSSKNYSSNSSTISYWNNNPISINNPNDVIIAVSEINCLVGIEDSIEHKTLYPNPSDNYVILKDASLTTYNLIDNMGSTLKTFDVDITPYQLFIGDLLTGNYYIVDAKRSIFYSFIKLAR